MARDEEKRRKHREYMREWSRKHPRYHHEQKLEAQRKWRANNPEKQAIYNVAARERAALYYEQHPERVQANTKSRYQRRRTVEPRAVQLEGVFWRNHYIWGCTREFFEELKPRLGGPCEICGAMGVMHIDHDHATNTFRGLLCRHCNYLLGNARDQIDVLEKAIGYLRSHG